MGTSDCLLTVEKNSYWLFFVRYILKYLVHGSMFALAPYGLVRLSIHETTIHRVLEVLSDDTRVILYMRYLTGL